MHTAEVIQVGVLALAWAAIWVNLSMLPFFRKRESLFRDYESSGTLDGARSAIESKKLLPSLARMYEGVMSQQEDKRRKIEISVLLQSADFIPDFQKAEAASRQIGELDAAYEAVRKASDFWKTAFVHVLSTGLVPVACFDFAKFDAWDWMSMGTFLPPLGVVWILTLVVTIRGLFRFHGKMRGFLSKLEAAKNDG